MSWRGVAGLHVAAIGLMAYPVRAADPAPTLAMVRDAAARAIAQVSVRDGRSEVAHDFAVALLRRGRCDDALAALRANPAALDSPYEQLSIAAIETKDIGCVASLGETMAAADLPASDFAPSPAPALHHTGAVLLTIAGRSDGSAAIRASEAALAVARPSVLPLAPNAPPRLRALYEALQQDAHVRERLAGRTAADEEVWEARREEVDLDEAASWRDGGSRYRAALDRAAVAALAAGTVVPADVLDSLAKRSAARGQAVRAAALMTAAARNETRPHIRHSLVEDRIDDLALRGDAAGAVALMASVEPRDGVDLTLAVGSVTGDQPTALLPYRARFDRWARDAATATHWLADLAGALAAHGDPADARATLAMAVDRLRAGGGAGDEGNAARVAAANAAALLGDDALAWALADAVRADQDVYVALVSEIAVGALAAGRDASADRALAALAQDQRGYVYERALTSVPHASVEARLRLVARALAFAAVAEPLQAHRIRLNLATATGEQLDLPDLTPAVLAATPPARRAALAIDAADRALTSAEVARERGQTAAQARGRARAVGIVDAALPGDSPLADEDRVKLISVLARLTRIDRGLTLAAAIADPRLRAHAYVTLLNWVPA